MTLLSILKQNRYFFIGYFLLILLALYFIVSFSKVEGHILLNTMHTKPLDYLFRGMTLLGDGIFVIGLVLVLWLFKNKYLALMILAGYLVSSIPVQVLKNIMDAARPAVFLKGIDYPYFVEGVTVHNYNSFPSGHTATAFALATCLVLGLKRARYGFVILLLATAVGYSRIYLSQHFIQDVFVGSIIGVLSGVLVFLFLDKWVKKITKKEISENDISK
ncbi:MAG: phosphatase PAP2 family protein [Ginsengibacter sp.]